ncbi:cyclin-D3-1-like [Curcuma longa]|uniref:cyclin-D3-1-like n=1 Tax=Curcuma longa TaxID=136217 RepID=UPI003D9EAE0C
MGVSFDYAPSLLRCPEGTNCILGLSEEEQDIRGETERRGLCRSPRQRCDFYNDQLDDFTLQSEEHIASLIERESHHLQPKDYAEKLLRGKLGLTIRSNSIDWILKVHAHYNFGHVSAYLSVNYLDRFFSSHDFLKDTTWMTQLVSVACLSLAAKMEEKEVPSSLDLQVDESKYRFEARNIQRMELLVLNTLNWRMHVVTPFSFIDYFLCEFNDRNSPDRLLLSSSMGLILGTVRDVNFLEFRPSEIAAAVALSSLRGSRILDTDNTLARCILVNKERVLRCCEVIQGMTPLMKNGACNNISPSVTNVPKSPIGVLDVACVSYKSDDTNTTSGLHVDCHTASPAPKKNKQGISTSS